MQTKLDHLILPVNHLETSIAFYTSILGFEDGGEREPFWMLRVSPDFVIQLAEWSTPGGQHLAFAMERSEFEEVFRRIRDAKIAFGDSFDAAGNMQGPGTADGARGSTTSLYCLDPSQHLIEVVHYDA